MHLHAASCLQLLTHLGAGRVVLVALDPVRDGLESTVVIVVNNLSDKMLEFVKRNNLL